MKKTNKEMSENSSSLRVNRAPVDSITIYEITESELSEIETSSPCDILFNIFIASISIGITFLVTLTTTNIVSDRLYCTYVIFCSICAVSAVLSFVNWKILRGKRTDVITKIKCRNQPAITKFGAGDNSVELVKEECNND